MVSGAPCATGEPLVSSQVDAVQVEISIVLGRSVIPMQQLLRMGRGAVITLDAKAQDEVWILANNHPVARARSRSQRQDRHQRHPRRRRLRLHGNG
jgi:flagellar motor switch/type III secretory pathway protein FliN